MQGTAGWVEGADEAETAYYMPLQQGALLLCSLEIDTLIRDRAKALTLILNNVRLPFK